VLSCQKKREWGVKRGGAKNRKLKGEICLSVEKKRGGGVGDAKNESSPRGKRPPPSQRERAGAS